MKKIVIISCIAVILGGGAFAMKKIMDSLPFGKEWEKSFIDEHSAQD